MRVVVNMTIESGVSSVIALSSCTYCCLEDGSSLANLSPRECLERGGTCSVRSDCVTNDIGLCCYGPVDENGNIVQNFQFTVDGLTRSECDKRITIFGGLYFKSKSIFYENQTSSEKPCYNRLTTTTTVGPNSCTEIDGYTQCDDNASACEWQYIQDGFYLKWTLIPDENRTGECLIDPKSFNAG